MNNVAIIPARGGSKRIPKKNIKLFLGKPIIAYSIKIAIDSNLFEEVIVSTDDLEIAKTAEKYGAKVPFLRSKKNSTDYSTTFDAIEEVLNEKYVKEKSYENVCCIYPCAPLISVESIIESYEEMKLNNFDAVFPLVKFGNKIQRALKINEKKVEMINSQFRNVRSQDLEDTFYDPGQFYWANIARLLINRNFFSNNSGFITLDEMSAQDIDTEIDWKIAEIKYSLLK
jgi:N-acylneuraminate cytidylyltransferase